MGQRYELFRRAKHEIRLHPELTDEQVAERVGAKLAEMDIIAEARKDYLADQQT